MFFIHHTAGPSCTTSERCAAILRGIQRFHMETRKWDDIAYSFLVGEDGRIYEGRGWKRVGSHTKGYNSKSLAVSVMGNFSSITPNTAALDAVRSLLTCAVDAGYLKKDYSLYGHRDVRPTECPGDAFYGLIRGWQHYNTTTDKDQGCVSQHGICQPTYLPCVGYFKTGLCNGYSKRQCCIRE
uniref:Putative peptidoglycan recognition protein n=1 Tax=Pinctada fucata TaxID=50426 RepID=A0A194AMH1_PINFU